MDYLQIYNEQFDDTWQKIKVDTISKLKLLKKNKKNFNKSFNKITNDLYKRRNQIIDDIRSTNLKTCLDLFENRHTEYDKNLTEDEVVSMIINNDIQQEFYELGNKGYELFVRKLAELKSITRTQIHFTNYFGYYSLIYDLNKYEYFFAKKFKNIHFEDSPEFKEMLILKRGEKLVGSKDLKVLKTTKKENDSKNKEDEKFMALIKNFSNKEKHFILAVLLDSIGSNNKNNEIEDQKTYDNLPLSEYLRILAIIKDIITYESFYKLSSKIPLYTELKKKHALIKKNEKTIFLSELKDKLRELKITQFQSFLDKFLKKNQSF